jgi:predicted ATPase
MLTELRLQNFKSWIDTGPIRLAPLTVIFGGNSAGKSSLGHLLLALKQTALSTDRKRALNLGDASTLVDLGTFADSLYDHDLSRKLMFDLAWQLPKPLEIRNAVQTRQRFMGDNLALHATLSADPRTSQPRTELLSYKLSANGETQLTVTASSKGNKYSLDATPMSLVRSQGRGWPIEEPEKFYRLSELSLARFQNAGFLTEFALETERVLRSMAYLGPLREAPRRMYQWSGDTPDDVGQMGQFAVPALLAADGEKRRLNVAVKQRTLGFSEFIAKQLQRLGVIHSFSVEPVAAGRKDYEVIVQTGVTGASVRLTDVGVGVSQVLPAIVQAFYCAPNSTVWMEQPEIHLHPQVQAELADVFIDAIHARENGTPRNVQIVVESHSEHFLNRLQRRIAEEEVGPDEIAIYFARGTADGAQLEPLRLNLYGDIENWPENFFGDDMADLTARTVAAAKRRKAAKG